MKTLSIQVGIFLTSVVCTLQLGGCAASVQESSLSSPSVGFVPEMDEPSGRGNVYRVTPEEVNVEYPFSILGKGR